jgi:hypothetical protein
MKKALATLLVLAVMVTSREAGAAEPEPEPDAGGDVLIGAGQVLSAMGVSLGGLMLAGAVDIGSPAGLAVLLATPSAVGATVCGVGKWSKYNQGSCAASIGGAYLGMLSVVPLGVIGYQLGVRVGGGGDWDGLGGVLLGLAAGWLVVQPVVTTVTWHLTKRPRHQAVALLPPPSRARTFAPPVLSRGRSRAPGQVTLTLPSARF